MGAGWLINCAMVVVAAAVFFRNGVTVTDILQAADTLRPLAGNLARTLFAVALLCAGISSSITACLAGGTVFTGFLGKEIDPQKVWFRAGVLVTALPALASGADPAGRLQDADLESGGALHAASPSRSCRSSGSPAAERSWAPTPTAARENSLLYLAGAVIIVLNVLLLLDFFGVRY